MAIKKVLALILTLICIGTVPILQGGLVQIDGKWSDEKLAPRYSVSEHYDLAYQMMGKKEWDRALDNFLIVTIHFPETLFFADSLFYSGVCYFQLKDYDLANKQFNLYLNLGGTLKHFEKAFEYKYEIANVFAQGARKHVFGLKKLPRLTSGKNEALALYDEIIASLPSKEIAAKSFFGKAQLLRKRKEYRESIEALQTLTKRFPRHTLAADAFLLISDIYFEQSKVEMQNPDLLSLAHINISRFQKSFPGDSRVDLAEGNAQQMKEIFAQSLYDTGRFYEKKRKSHASIIYYNEALKRYPGTVATEKGKQRLAKLKGAESLAQK